MKILLFGATGMLGTYVHRILSQSHEVIPFGHSHAKSEIQRYDARFDEPPLESLIETYRSSDLTVIVNCAGLIPQRLLPKQPLQEQGASYMAINTQFPQRLNKLAQRYQLHMIHITTDCVFSGETGHYDEHAKHDATSLYGRSKSLGEPSTACVIRTSIIGEEAEDTGGSEGSPTQKSLLEWVCSKKGQKINGYINHYWNGVTCLTLAQIIKQIIDHNLYWRGVRHIFSPTAVTKYQLCTHLNHIYELGLTEIHPIVTKEDCDRTLTSIDPPIFTIAEIWDQIAVQKMWGELGSARPSTT